MLKLLLKKQFIEMFRSFFYDQKKKTARSKGSSVLWIIMFVFLMVFVLGGMFTALAVSLCAPLFEAGVGWLYYVVMGLTSLCLGVFGSVFNTYAGLYLAKDNDFLLSLPIPVNKIMISRLLSVYLLGLMYSAIVLLPAVAVACVAVPFSFAHLIGGIVTIAVVSMFVLVLSCLLGWVVAKISLRLKKKSIAVVLVSVLFIVGYYYVYFKAQELIRELVANAVYYGERIKGAFYAVYLFGRMGEGNVPAMLIFIFGAAALFALVWFLLSRTFLKIATSAGAIAKTAYREKKAVRRSSGAALLRKEFSRFISSPLYMLNCGLGILLLPAAGIAILLKGGFLADMLCEVFGALPGSVFVLFSAALCLLASMNDITAPSISLEGKNFWLIRSLPVTSVSVLNAKLALHLLLTLPGVVFCLICGVISLRDSVAVMVPACLCVLGFTIFNALFGLFLGLKMPMLDWTNETVPIKQSMSVTIALFGGWGVALLLGGGYLLVGRFIGAPVFLWVFFALIAGAGAGFWFWIKKNGAAIFEAL